MHTPAGSPDKPRQLQHEKGSDKRATSRERAAGYGSRRDRDREELRDYPGRPSSRASQLPDGGRERYPADRYARDRHDEDVRHRGDYKQSYDDGRGPREDRPGLKGAAERDRDRERDKASRPPAPSGRAAPMRGSAGSRQRSPTSSRDRGPPDERGTPGSESKRARDRGTPLMGVNNPLLAELRRQGKLLASSKAGDGSGDDDTEAGEIVPDKEPPAAGPAGAGHKRKHSPIQWDPPGKQPRGEAAPAAGPQSLLERTQQEAQALRELQMDYDPDAPAAMKASPTVSLSEGGHDDDEHGTDNGLHANGDTNGDVPTKKGLSRWLQQEEDEAEAAQGNGDVSGAGASPAGPEPSQGPGGSGLGRPEGPQQGQSFESDSEDEGGPAAPAPPVMRYDMRRECRDVHDFERVERISEGTYGVVYKAREKATGRIVALKRVKMEHETNGFPITSVREINILLNFHHPNIVNVEEVVVSPRHPDQIYMVMEYMDHDLKSLMEDKKRFSQPFSAGQVKCLMQQLLGGVAFLHHNWVLHRDLKTSNILYNSKGDLKLCDFGMARQYGEPLGTYTHNVVTLWYRAPELLFGCEQYSTAMDVWSVGCIMGEILTGKPLLPGQGEFDQIDKMVQLLGTPTKEEWPGLEALPNYRKINLKQMPSTLRQRFTAATGFVGTGTNLTEAGFDLLSRLLAWDPDKRISAADALKHRWFSEVPLPVNRVLMPTFAPRKAG